VVAVITVVAVTAAGLVLLRGRPTRLRRLASRPGTGRRATAPVARWLAPRLVAADVPWPAEVAAAVWVAGVAGLGGLGLAAGGAALGAVAGAAALVGPPIALATASGRQEARLEAELPGLLAAVARSLRSGASIPAALREASALDTVAATDLAEVVAEADSGLPLADALGRWAVRRPRPGIRLVVGTLSVALTSGGMPARAVDGAAATLRERSEVDREVRALATQARLSAVVVTVAPLVFAALGVLGDGRTATFLLRTPTGLACLTVGVALDAFGGWWMARIAGSA
jgi:tight adherence protein B